MLRREARTEQVDALFIGLDGFEKIVDIPIEVRYEWRDDSAVVPETRRIVVSVPEYWNVPRLAPLPGLRGPSEPLPHRVFRRVHETPPYDSDGARAQYVFREIET